MKMMSVYLSGFFGLPKVLQERQVVKEWGITRICNVKFTSLP